MVSRTVSAFGLTNKIVVLLLISPHIYPLKDSVQPTATQILSDWTTNWKAAPCLLGMLKCWEAVCASLVTSYLSR